MLIKNQSIRRCLVLSKNSQLKEMLRQILDELQFQTDLVGDRKNALKLFLQYKHYLICVEAQFLPRFPFRLMQTFKIAHRTPGIMIFNESNKNLSGFTCLRNNFIKVVETPFINHKIKSSICEINNALTIWTKNDFIKNLILLLSISIPAICFTIYFIVSNFIK